MSEQELQYAYLLEIPVESAKVVTKRQKKRMRFVEKRLKVKALQVANKKGEEPLATPFAEGEVLREAEKTDVPVLSETAQEETVLQEPAVETVATEEVSAEALSEQAGVLPSAEETLADFMSELPSALPEEEKRKEKGRKKRARKGARDEKPQKEEWEKSLPADADFYRLQNRWVESAEKVKRKAHADRQKRGAFLSAVGVCALGAVLFLLNIFFFNLDLAEYFTGTKEQKTDARLHDSFAVCMPSAGNVESREGALVFNYKGGIYAPADGKVTSVTVNEAGLYTVEIAHSDCFKTVISGTDMSFYSVGDTVYRAQPIAYSLGKEVTVTFYEKGEKTECRVEEGALCF